MCYKKNFRIGLLKWVLIGFLIRLLLMPFTFHGSDIFVTYYAPYKLLSEGSVNPYQYMKDKSLDRYTPYYPPVTFYFFSFFLLLLKPFLPNLKYFYSIFEPNFFKFSLNTVQYADQFVDADILRTLFVFKIPYLLADFFVVYILLKIFRESSNTKLSVVKLWMLNPFLLHSCYMLGQSDVVPTLFVVAAFLFLLRERYYIALLLLCLSAGTKGYPALLIPPVILIAAQEIRERIKLSLFSIFITIGILLPFFIASGEDVFSSFNVYMKLPNLRKYLFMSIYLLWIFVLLFFKRQKKMDVSCVIAICTITLFIFFTTYSVTLRHFLVVTPFLIYLFLKDKRYKIYIIMMAVSLFWLRTAGNSQQWGLFATLHPEFFSSLPILDSYLNVIVNVKYIHQIMYGLFFIFSLIMIAHIFIVNRDLFKLPWPTYLKRNEKS